MRAEIKDAHDGRHLVAVRFQRASPDGNEPAIEVIFHLHWPDDFTVKSDPFVLLLLSTTRIDTREPVGVTKEEMAEVMTTAVSEADRYDQSLLER